jgi:hypothetical protein
VSNIPWQGLPDLAKARRQQMRAGARSWRTWRQLWLAQRERRRRHRQTAPPTRVMTQGTVVAQDDEASPADVGALAHR